MTCERGGPHVTREKAWRLQRVDRLVNALGRRANPRFNLWDVLFFVSFGGADRTPGQPLGTRFSDGLFVVYFLPEPTWLLGNLLGTLFSGLLFYEGFCVLGRSMFSAEPAVVIGQISISTP